MWAAAFRGFGATNFRVRTGAQQLVAQQQLAALPVQPPEQARCSRPTWSSSGGGVVRRRTGAQQLAAHTTVEHCNGSRHGVRIGPERRAA